MQEVYKATEYLRNKLDQIKESEVILAQNKSKLSSGDPDLWMFEEEAKRLRDERQRIEQELKSMETP